MKAKAHASLQGRPHFAGALVAAGVALMSLALPLIPGASEVLQWDRQDSGSPVSWITSHLTHWSWEHLAWDLAAFAILSILALRLIPQRYLACLSLAAVSIPLEIWWNQEHLDRYRGLSGIDSALFGLTLVGLWKTGDHAFPWPRILAGASGIAFFGKMAFEFATGTTVFVSADQAPFVPAVSAHLVGFACGLLAGGLGPSTDGSESPLQNG